ncbi:MAG: secondary thiamine-phosphate synthase enzyme YjbQ [Myxococcota bacterium]|nr:secondary thiamine-phosphate synthase enzyme YjbQ [Myxococcota bacterium]
MQSVTIHQHSWRHQTTGRGPVEITQTINNAIAGLGLSIGLCTIFLEHTSASLLLCENADPTVLTDLETHFAQFAPDSDTKYVHSAEGPDDMPAHLRTVFTQNSLTIPISGGQLRLGTWQGVFLWEHRCVGRLRQLSITAFG